MYIYIFESSVKLLFPPLIIPTIKINAPDQNPPTMSDFRDTPTTSSLSGTNSPTQ